MSRAKSFFKKLADTLGLQLPVIEVTPEREDEIIEKMIGYIKGWRMEDWAILGLAYFQPMSAVFSYTMLLPWAPILHVVGFENVWEYVAFLSKHENIKIVMERLDKETRRS